MADFPSWALPVLSTMSITIHDKPTLWVGGVKGKQNVSRVFRVYSVSRKD